MSFIAIRLRTRPFTSARTSSPGSSTSRNVFAIGRAAETSFPSTGKTFSSHHWAISGKERRRRVSPCGSAVDDDHVELAGFVVALDLEQAEELVHAGRHGQLLGSDIHDSALQEHLPEPALDLSPVRLHLALGLDLLPPEIRPYRRWVGAEPELERVGKRVRRVGGEHHGPEACGGCPARARCRHGRLSDAALPGVEDRPGTLVSSRSATVAGNRTHYRSPAPALNEKRTIHILNRTKTLLAALAVAVLIPVAGCGGDEESDEDPADVLEATFNNDETIESGVIDLTFDLSAEGDQGGSLTANVTGPFVSDPENPSGLGQLDLDVSLSGEGAAAEALGDIEASLTVTEDNLYVGYNGTDYELGTEAFEQLQAQQEEAAGAAESEDAALSFTEGCEQAIEAQGGDPAACDFDVTAWFSDLSNEGTEDVGGADATHISGSLDVEQMLTDLFELGASVPGATGGVDPSLIQGQLGQISEAVSGATFDVYSATEDNTLRGLDFGLELDAAAIGGAAAGVESAGISFSVEIADVGEEQTIEAPADAKPINDLAGDLGGAIPGLPGGDVPEIDGGGAGLEDVDPQCIQDAAGDPDAIQECLE